MQLDDTTQEIRTQCGEVAKPWLEHEYTAHAWRSGERINSGIQAWFTCASSLMLVHSKRAQHKPWHSVQYSHLGQKETLLCFLANGPRGRLPHYLAYHPRGKLPHYLPEHPRGRTPHHLADHPRGRTPHHLVDHPRAGYHITCRNIQGAGTMAQRMSCPTSSAISTSVKSLGCSSNSGGSSSCVQVCVCARECVCKHVTQKT